MTAIHAGITRTPMGIFVLEDDTHLSKWVADELSLDLRSNLREIAEFASFIPPGGLVIDAGACLGDHALTYSQIVGQEGTVYALEPHPLTYQALALNMGRLNNVVTYNVGLGETAGVYRMHTEPNIGASYLTETGEVLVEIVTLDGVLPMLPRCDLIHLDAEGFEPQILRGGTLLFQKFSPVLVIELCDHHLRRTGSSEAEFLDQLAAMGYDVVMSLTPHTNPPLRDIVCTRKSLPVGR
jgi:FkbM family methyltransferase